MRLLHVLTLMRGQKASQLTTKAPSLTGSLTHDPKNLALDGTSLLQLENQPLMPGLRFFGHLLHAADGRARN